MKDRSPHSKLTSPREKVISLSHQLWSSGSLISYKPQLQSVFNTCCLSGAQLLSVHPGLWGGSCSSLHVSPQPVGTYTLQFRVRLENSWFCTPWIRCSGNNDMFLKVRQPIWSAFSWVRQSSHHTFPGQDGYFWPSAGSYWEHCYLQKWIFVVLANLYLIFLRVSL